MDSTELAAIRTDELATFTDTGVRGVYTEGARNEVGEIVPTWPAGESTSCLVLFTGGQERRGTDIQPVEWDAIARVPYDYIITYRDRFTFTHRFGVELDTPITFQVEGRPQHGMGHIRLQLRQVMP